MRKPLRRALDWIDSRILEANGGGSLALPPLSNRQSMIERLFLLLATVFYCLPFLDLNSLNRLRGNESEVFQSLDQFLRQGLMQAGRFPLWNPYIYTGIPYAADPMLHAYNPLITIPILLFGALNGFKIAVFLGFLVGAFGMWWLARLLGLGAVGRLWMSLLFAFSGVAMARFFQGQYLLQMAVAWLPWITAGLYASLITRRRRYIGVAALSSALLFLCGNAYYAYYTLYAIAIMALVMVVQLHFRPLRVRVDLPSIKVLLTIGVLAAGLIAAQLLPLASFWSLIGKATDRSLQGSQTVQQVFLDLVSTDSNRPDAIAALPPEEFYAYIGLAPFILLVFLPLAWRKGNRRILIYFAVLAGFALLWIDVRDMPWRSVFQAVPLLYQFRYPTRMLVFETLALVALSGMAADALFRRIESCSTAVSPGWLQYVLTVLKYALAGLLLACVVSVAGSHRRELASQEYYPAPDVVLGWLRRQDSSLYYIDAPNGWHRAVFENRLRYLNAWYHFSDIKQLNNKINTRDVQATAKYEILGNDAPAPPGSTLVHRFDQHTIYLHPDSLPFAFLVPTAALTAPAAGDPPLQQTDTKPVDIYTPNTDSIEAIVNGEASQTLVVLSTLAPGWILTVDDRTEPVLNVSGYLATFLFPGIHRYVFSYRPATVPLGWFISLVFLLVTLTLTISDMAWNWSAVAERIRRTIWRGPMPKPGVPQPAPSADSSVPRAIAPQAPAESLALLDYVRSLPQRLAATSPNRMWWKGIAQEALTWQEILFVISIGIYLIAVLYRNSDFPIFFFTDEAVHMNEAADLLTHGFQNSQHEFLPTYFNIGTMFSLNSLSVYLQLIPYLLLGKSVAVTRAVSSIVTVFGAIAASLTLRNVFNVRRYWLGALVLIASPAWFLHARTAFEYAELAAFYSIFIYCYLQYRAGRPRYLYAAVLSGAAVFYTHGLGQVLIGVAGLALFLVDFRFHFQPENRRRLLYALGLLILLAAPYFRYQYAHPDVTVSQISQRGSYLVDNGLTLLQKLGRFAHEYFYGLSPLYWYFPNDHDVIRHVMKGYGHIWVATLPFALLGLGLSIRQIRNPQYRVLVVALLAAPIPASLVAVGILRELWLMVPAALLTALGMEKVLSWLEARYGQTKASVLAPAVLFLALAGFTLFMLNDALTNGPTWYQDYTLYGMQYGGRQVFGEAILSGLRSDPNLRYVVSPNWANGTDQLMFFFIPPPYRNRVALGTVDDYMTSKQDLTPNTILVTLKDEYDRAQSSPLFSKVDVVRTLPDPNGQPGFYLLHLTYADNVDAVFAQVEAERRQPVHGTVTIEGDQATITYSRIEAGQPSDMFDGKLETLVRGVEANPFMVELVFQKPLPMSSLSGDFGHMSAKVQVSLYVNPGDVPLQFDATDLNPPGEPHVNVNFGVSYAVTRVLIEITNLDVPGGQPAKIHIRELRFNP